MMFRFGEGSRRGLQSNRRTRTGSYGRQNRRLCVSPMQMTRPPMFNIPSRSNLIYRVSESSRGKKSTTPETIVSLGTKRVLSNLCRDVATEVGCSARLVLVQPMAGWAANLQSELDGFEQRNVALHLIIPVLRDFKKKILPGHMLRTIQGARFQQKKRQWSVLCFNIKALMINHVLYYSKGCPIEINKLHIQLILNTLSTWGQSVLSPQH